MKNGVGGLKIKLHGRSRRGFLRGRIREVAVEFLEIAIIGGIQSLESISNIIYPVLLPRRAFTAEVVETKSRGWNRLN